VDSVTGSFEVYTRGRALFSTVAYMSIHKHEWFSFDDAEFVSDKLLTFVNQEYQGKRPPLSFYVHAWASTMQRFSEAVRVNKANLGTIVRATSSWEHLWTMWQPGTSGQTSEAAVGQPDDYRLADEVARLKKLAAHLQSDRDKYKAELNKRNEGDSAADRGANGGRKRTSAQENSGDKGGQKSWWHGRKRQKGRK